MRFAMMIWKWRYAGRLGSPWPDCCGWVRQNHGRNFLLTSDCMPHLSTHQIAANGAQNRVRWPTPHATDNTPIAYSLPTGEVGMGCAPGFRATVRPGWDRREQGAVGNRGPYEYRSVKNEAAEYIAPASLVTVSVSPRRHAGRGNTARCIKLRRRNPHDRQTKLGLDG